MYHKLALALLKASKCARRLQWMRTVSTTSRDRPQTLQPFRTRTGNIVPRCRHTRDKPETQLVAQTHSGFSALPSKVIQRIDARHYEQEIKARRDKWKRERYSQSSLEVGAFCRRPQALTRSLPKPSHLCQQAVCKQLHTPKVTTPISPTTSTQVWIVSHLHCCCTFTAETLSTACQWLWSSCSGVWCPRMAALYASRKPLPINRNVSCAKSSTEVVLLECSSR